jgi:metal-responsive CopG/Arc/MetJ family transcriptional regulator
MGNKMKVTVTIDEAIVREIDRASKESGESRSRVIEKAIQEWRRKELERQLIEGYRAMAKEDAETAEANLAAGVEVLT